jgi:hypothetical protein
METMKGYAEELQNIVGKENVREAGDGDVVDGISPPPTSSSRDR